MLRKGLMKQNGELVPVSLVHLTSMSDLATICTQLEPPMKIEPIGELSYGLLTDSAVLFVKGTAIPIDEFDLVTETSLGKAGHLLLINGKEKLRLECLNSKDYLAWVNLIQKVKRTGRQHQALSSPHPHSPKQAKSFLKDCIVSLFQG
jgi:hypothetical protein